MKYLYLLNTYIHLFFKVTFLSKRYTRQLLKELKQNLGADNVLFSKKKTERIRSYIIQMILLSSWTCVLRGQKLKKEEKLKTIYLGAFIPLFDDLTDDLKLTSSEIFAAFNKEDLTTNRDVLIAKYLFGRLMENHGPNFKQIFFVALKAQDQSLQQLEKKQLDDDELKKITKEKGGNSTLLHRLLLNDSLKPGEADAIIQLGYAFQQVNDMFDVYKDHKNEQQTLFTNSKNIKVNDDLYQTTIQEVTSRFLTLDYKKENIKKCLIQISTILGRGQVCIDQLKALQEKSGGTFEIETFKREQLICDMEKLSNVFKSFNYSVQFRDALIHR